MTLGMALEQTIEGDCKSFTLNYIDWRNPENNVFHVTAEFAVERTRSNETRRPDIVLFVNGIPFAVIECKSPKVEVEQAVSQMIRNQRDEYIPHLFTYVQTVLAVNKNEARYATTGTPAKFWAKWKEEREQDEDVGARCWSSPLPEAVKAVAVRAGLCRGFGVRERDGAPTWCGRQVTEQDRRSTPCAGPERLLEMACGSPCSTAACGRSRATSSTSRFASMLERVKQRDEGRRRAAASSGTPRARASR